VPEIPPWRPAPAELPILGYQFARLKKLVGLIAMAALVTTAGWGLVPATAGADTDYRDDPGCFSWCGPGPGDHDRDFDHDRGFPGFFPFFFGR